MQDITESNYEILKMEMENFHSNMLKVINVEPGISSLYKAWKVFFSPLLYKPDVMFIGINPGNGEEGFDCEYCDKGELEYLYVNYSLATETLKVFELANRFDLLYNSVKTNYYYLATTGEGDIEKLAKYLGRGNKEMLGERLLLNARTWTKKLIEITEPKLIICEGASAFTKVTDLFMNGIKMIEDVEHIYVEEIGASIIGYKRVRHSYIKDKEGLATILAELTS